MKPFTEALGALFDTQTFVSADLYVFQLPGGGEARLTSADVNLTWGGYTYLSGNPRIDRSALSQKTGIEVSTVKIDVYPTANDIIGNGLWLQALQRGFFDGAAVTISRAFAPAWGQPVTGTIILMAGRVADAKFGRSKVTIEVNSWTEILKNPMPRTYYQSPCNNTLGDARCGVNVPAFAEIGSITYVENASIFAVNNYAPAGFFTYGRMTMTSGLCNTETRPIAFAGGPAPGGQEFVLQIPFSRAPAVGDTFLAYPGCDKTKFTCQTKYNNLSNFTGYPFIPAPEMAV